MVILIEPKKPPRFMTVEVARSFGVSDKSPLCAALFTEKAMTAVQAVACLGRSIRVGVVRKLLRMLRALLRVLWCELSSSVPYCVT